MERRRLPKPDAADISSSMDFVSAGLADGRKLRCLVIVGDSTPERMAIEIVASLADRRVVGVLEHLADTRSLPGSITVDCGPEFEGQVLDASAFQRGVRLAFIRPGRPVGNGDVEGFNWKFRDECLNKDWFITLAQAERIIESWRIEYKTGRPRTSLGNVTPSVLAVESRRKTKESLSLTAGSDPQRY